jgi:hypothetical protein
MQRDIVGHLTGLVHFHLGQQRPCQGTDKQQQCSNPQFVTKRQAGKKVHNILHARRHRCAPQDMYRSQTPET